VLDAYHESKIHTYQTVAAVAGWTYMPMTMTCYGRPHASTSSIVHRLAMAAARRFGVEDAGRMEEHWWRNCSVLLAERVARMVMRCSPTIRMPRTLGGGADADEDAGGAVQGREADVSAVVVTEFGQ
jgi:hypothetical protein